jgi:hypothetical protein
MLGILISGLKYYHQVTGEPAVGDAIVGAARFLVRDMWEEERGAFRYTSCPKSGVGTTLNYEIMEGIGYAARLSGDKELTRIFVKGTRAALRGRGSSISKSLVQSMRFTPRILFDLSQMEK